MEGLRCDRFRETERKREREGKLGWIKGNLRAVSLLGLFGGKTMVWEECMGVVDDRIGR